MGGCLFNSWVTDTLALRSDELLSLFALLILLSTVAIQIRVYGPLGSQEGGQPQLVAQVCIRVCMSVCSKIDTTIHSGEGIGCSSLSFCTSIFL